MSKIICNLSLELKTGLYANLTSSYLYESNKTIIIHATNGHLALLKMCMISIRKVNNDMYFYRPKDNGDGTLTYDVPTAELESSDTLRVIGFGVSVSYKPVNAPYSQVLHHCTSDKTTNTVEPYEMLLFIPDKGYTFRGTRTHVNTLINNHNNEHLQSAHGPMLSYSVPYNADPNGKIEIIADPVIDPSIVVDYPYKETLEHCTSDVVGDRVTPKQVVTLTANSGYTFDGTGVNIRTFSHGSFHTTTITEKGDSIQFTLPDTLDSNIDLELHATPVSKIVDYPYSETLLHCTSDVVGDRVLPKQVVTLTANSGYNFDGTGVTMKTFSHGSISHVPITDKGKIIHITLPDTLDTHIDLEIEATPVADKVEMKITGNFDNVTHPDSVDVTQESVIDFTTHKGYAFVSDYEYQVNGGSWVKLYPTMMSNRITFDFSNLGVTNTDTINFNLKAFDSTITAKYSESLIHCTSSFTGLTDIPVGTNFVILTADTGYVFNEEGSVLILNHGNGASHPIVPPTDSTSIIAPFPDVVDNDIVSLMITAEQPTQNPLSFIKIFNPTQREMEGVVSSLFSGNSNNSDYLEQMIKMIRSLFIIPFEIDDKLLNDPTEIYLGLFGSNVSSKIVNDYKIEIDLGSVDTPEHYHNSHDYNSECTLYLPYASGIKLDPSYVIGQTLSIKYILDLYTCDCSVIVTSTLTNEPVYIGRVDVCTKLPYTLYFNEVMGGQFNSPYRNGILTPFIEVTVNNPVDVVNINQGDSVYKQGKVSEFNGYIEMDNVKMSGDMTNIQLDEIISLLKSGVYL